MSVDAAKFAAGVAAAALVQPGMLVGLGSGSTVRFAIEELGRRVREEGLRITGVPTSLATERLARHVGLPLVELDAQLDLAIDGADEVVQTDGAFQLIKGLGGALLREKMVAQRARRFVVVAEVSKVVAVLGQRVPVPVEVTPFGIAATTRRLSETGAQPTLRRQVDGSPFVTDGGNWVLDCAGLAPIREARVVDARLRSIAGVLETGLFLDLSHEVFVAHQDGRVEVLRAV